MDYGDRGAAALHLLSFSNILTTLGRMGGFFKEAQVARFMMMMN